SHDNAWQAQRSTSVESTSPSRFGGCARWPRGSRTRRSLWTIDRGRDWLRQSPRQRCQALRGVCSSWRLQVLRSASLVTVKATAPVLVHSRTDDLRSSSICDPKRRRPLEQLRCCRLRENG